MAIRIARDFFLSFTSTRQASPSSRSPLTRKKFASLSRGQIQRSVLGSGGTPFSLLMPRSVDFGAYHELLKMNFPGARDTRLMLSLMQVRAVLLARLYKACCSRGS